MLVLAACLAVVGKTGERPLEHRLGEIRRLREVGRIPAKIGGDAGIGAEAVVVGAGVVGEGGEIEQRLRPIVADKQVVAEMDIAGRAHHQSLADEGVLIDQKTAGCVDQLERTA